MSSPLPFPHFTGVLKEAAVAASVVAVVVVAESMPLFLWSFLDGDAGCTFASLATFALVFEVQPAPFAVEDNEGANDEDGECDSECAGDGCRGADAHVVTTDSPAAAAWAASGRRWASLKSE